MDAGTSDIIVRPARHEDVAAICAIYRESVLNESASYEVEAPEEAEMARRYHAVVKNGFPYLVAAAQDHVAAYAHASAFRLRPAYRYTVEDSIYVAADMRGKGIGKLLLKALIDEIEKCGFRQVIAVIGGGRRESASVRLHRQAGFRHAGTLEGSGYKFGRWLDTTLMQLSLNGGSATIPPEG